MLWPWPFLFTCIKLCEESDRATVDILVLWAVAIGLLVAWLCANVLFALLCRWRFLRTFVLTETAAQFTKRTKWDGSNDEKKAKVLTRLHHGFCRLFRDEAKQWLQEGFPRWEEERPEW